MNEKTKVYAIFKSTGLDHRGAWDASDIKEHVLSNEKILSELEKRCEGIEFIGKVNLVDEERRDRISRAHYGKTEEERRLGSETHAIANKRLDLAIKNILELRDELGGIVIFGSPSDRFMSLGLPIVAVFPMWGTWMTGFKFKAFRGKRILTAFLPVVRDASESIFESRLEDLAKKIRLIGSLSRMRGLRVLVITDRPVLGSYEYGRPGLDTNDYQKRYLRDLDKTFGVKLVNVTQDELLRRVQKIGDEDVADITKDWIRRAKGIKGTVETEIMKSAKVYRAMKELMAEHHCQAITAEGYGIFAEYEKGPIPSQGLASSQFLTDGVTATSECLINSLITQQLGSYITGRPSFNGDYIIDLFNKIAIVGHCECPFNPFGDERRSPYFIRNLPRWRKNEGGACVQVDLPVDQIVTVMQISVYDSRISVFTGTSASGRNFFNKWDDLGCRTKLAIETDTESLLRNVDWDMFGAHRVVFYGDLRAEIKDLAALIGYDVVEEDR